MHPIAQYLLDQWVSLLALGISAYLLWRDNLQPFRLNAIPAGRISIARNPFSAALSEDCILIDLVFTNVGAKRGVVNDIALVVRVRDVAGVFRTLAVQGDRSLNLTTGLPPPALETFLSFNLTKSESLVRRILFVPYTLGATKNLLPGMYTVEVYCRSTERTGWQKKSTSKFAVDDGDMQALNRSSSVPSESGGHFVTWLAQDKVLQDVDLELARLAKDCGKV